MDQKIRKKWKRIEDIMAAVSFAEEGEAEAAQSLVRREQRVLLALREGEAEAKTLTYARKSAERIGASLDILVIAQEKGLPRPDPVLEQFEKDLKDAGVLFRVARKSGCLKQEIIDYTNTEREVLFVVIESPDSLETECRHKDVKLADLWRRLRCPLVVVSEGAGA